MCSLRKGNYPASLEIRQVLGSPQNLDGEDVSFCALGCSKRTTGEEKQVLKDTLETLF